MRALVTSSRNPFALDIIRKLGSSGHYVVASDTYAGATGSHSRYAQAHGVTASPTFDTDQFIEDISTLVTEHDIEVILPSFEEVFYLVARENDLPEGAEVYSGSFADLARLHDKASFRNIVEASGVPIPETVVVSNEQELADAIAKFPRYFARAAFSRGGVALLTNTGALAGAMAVEDCHPTRDQPWLVQPFVDGPMVCSYSIIVDGRITAHCTYIAPEQWEHSTGIMFRSVDSTDTLEYTRKLIAELDPYFTGQLSFDWVDHDGQLYSIECNPRPTNGVTLMPTEALVNALTGVAEETYVVPPGVEREIKAAVIADAFAEPIKHLPHSVHDVFAVKDVGSGWWDGAAMLWSPAALVHGAKLAHGHRQPVLEALGGDIVWNGDEIVGMSEADAKLLEEVHAQKI